MSPPRSFTGGEGCGRRISGEEGGGGKRRKGEWGDGGRGRSYEIHSRIVGRALVPKYDLLASPESESATARLSLLAYR